MSCTDAGQHYIRRCTDQSSVSAQTCAQGQCPPERHNVHTTLTHGVDQWDHRCYEWNIVQCCRQQCGYPQNDHHRQDSLTACCVHDDVSQIVDHACFYHTAYYDEQRGKEDDRRPFYVFYNTFYILFAYDDHDHRSSQRDDGRFHMKHTVKGEACYDQHDHDNTLRQQSFVLDQSLFIHIHNCLHRFRRCDQLLFVNQLEGENRCDHYEDNDQTVVYPEVYK